MNIKTELNLRIQACLLFNRKYLEDDHATRGCVSEYARATMATAAMTSRCMRSQDNVKAIT